MRRREFITLAGGAAVWPLAVRAQQIKRMRRIGVLMPLSANDPEAQARVAAFLQGLQELGWRVGSNVTIDIRWSADNADARKYATELIALAPDVMLANSTMAAAPLVQMTRTVPIVFTNVADPVGSGFVDSLARPGGNATGVNDFLTEVDAKRLRLLHDMVPKAARVAVLVNPGNVPSAKGALQGTQEAAAATGLQLRILNATTIAEIDAAFASFAQDRPDALFVAADAFFATRAAQFITLTARDRIPAAYSIRDYVIGGGLMSYGADLTEIAHQVGIYTGKILKGAEPADLPVLQSTKFNFALNLQTARALGIEVPSGVLSIADEVIE
jgi:putative tryptophan/tyrosine transport system substrate-binding protein